MVAICITAEKLFLLSAYTRESIGFILKKKITQNFEIQFPKGSHLIEVF
jgi:hypothetical protein